VCAAEERFLTAVLGGSVERRAHIVSGCNACEYAVNFGAAAPAESA
jgi:predicted ArsR family transcriptional regulator